MIYSALVNQEVLSHRDIPYVQHRNVHYSFIVYFVFFFKNLPDGIIHGVSIFKARYCELLDPFPKPVDRRTRYHLLHFAKQLVRVIDPFFSSKNRSQIAREYRVKIDRANKVTFLKKQKDKQAEVVFDIKPLSFFRKTVKSFLMINLR
jgi:hypothetical protein